ncbi:MAG: hypothetical protein OXT72_13125 [Gammaproteobacteria bacterium]|nr:hypothetical protein [Gammaproteobacteria bacterium]MDE0247163.1 hypothetical protein [Gammaproteobacteria bacterium]
MLEETRPRIPPPGEVPARGDLRSDGPRGPCSPGFRAASLAGALWSLLLAGCGSSTAPAPPVLSGPYAFEVNIIERRDELRCHVGGTVEFTQDGESFSASGSGVVTCSGLGTEFTREERSRLEGRLTGNAVRMEFAILGSPCEAEGNARGDPVETLSGTVRCTFAIEERIYTLDGRWEAVAGAARG